MGIRDVDLIDAEIHRRLIRKHNRYHWVDPLVWGLIASAVLVIAKVYI